ncbi:hypothetical protein MCOR07_011148 [Pyricularia oryzae]|nr:hypothetical protein MCOR30_011021 [Pyricularia oryzae]KAI6329963.1 hypothetical protein MCOR29_002048 [Pyricularia oryzae]KAI6385870.1 hypothetical protein MCOR32_001298 [Pyricularia oryzae]KAI6418963.1 hypothetical protein MCOR21_010560 [Pyricularia oryzae]KAI6446296.1 hypothetical protein MCOR15_010522 [Pyricularia oryzae]
MPARSSSRPQNNNPPPSLRLQPPKPVRDLRRPSYDISLSPIPGSVRDEMSDEEDRRPKRHMSKLPQPLDPFRNGKLGDANHSQTAPQCVFTPRPSSSLYSVEGVINTQHRQDSPTRIPQPSKRLLCHERQSSESSLRTKSLTGRVQPPGRNAPIIEVDTPPETPRHEPELCHNLDEPYTVPFGLLHPPATPSHTGSRVSVEERSGATNSSGDTYDSLSHLHIVRHKAQLNQARKLLYAEHVHRSIAVSAARSPGGASIKSSTSSPGRLTDLSKTVRRHKNAESPMARTKTCGIINEYSTTVCQHVADVFAPPRVSSGGRSPSHKVKATYQTPKSLERAVDKRQLLLTESTRKAAEERSNEEKKRLRMKEQQRMEWEMTIAKAKASIRAEETTRATSRLDIAKPKQSLRVSADSPPRKTATQEKVDTKNEKEPGFFSRFRQTLRFKRTKSSLAMREQRNEVAGSPKQKQSPKTEALPKMPPLNSLRHPKSMAAMEAMTKVSPPQQPKIPERRHYRMHSQREQPSTLMRIFGSSRDQGSRPMRSLPNIRRQAQQTTADLHAAPTRTPPKIPMSVLLAASQDDDDEDQDAVGLDSSSPSEQRRHRQNLSRSRLRL